jgi:hypothetical protein
MKFRGEASCHAGRSTELEEGTLNGTFHILDDANRSNSCRKYFDPNEDGAFDSYGSAGGQYNPYDHVTGKHRDYLSFLPSSLELWRSLISLDFRIFHAQHA